MRNVIVQATSLAASVLAYWVTGLLTLEHGLIFYDICTTTKLPGLVLCKHALYLFIFFYFFLWHALPQSLLTYVTDRTNLCIISDRHRGIQSCFDDTEHRGYLQLPLVHHRYCLRHLVSNVNTNFNSVALKNLVWKATTVNQVRKFENTMDCIKNVNPDAYD